MDKTVTATILDFESLNSSVNGAPRWRISFDDGETRTSQSDASWCWGFGNPEMREGTKVVMTITRSGTIRTMRPA